MPISLQDLQTQADGAAPPQDSPAPPPSPPQDDPQPAPGGPPESVAAEPDDEPPPAEPEGDEPPVDGAGAAPEAEADFFGFLRDEFGEDLSDQFSSEYQAIKSLVEARRLVGKRNEEAQKYRELAAAAGGEEAVQKLLAQKQVAPSPGQPKQPELPSYEQLQLWEAQIAQAEAQNKQPPAGLEEQVRAAREEYGRRIFRAASLIPQLEETLQKVQSLGPAVDPQEIEARLQQVQEQAAAERWASENRHVLFVGGDQGGKLTPTGLRVIEIHNELEAKGMPGRLDRLDVAIRLAQQEQPKPKPTRPGSPRAVRQPAIAAPAAESVSAGEFFDKGGGLADYYTKGPGRMTGA